jgi:hypothetical protein
VSATLCVRGRRNCCVAMADAWARATGKIGVGSVTCGPGYTQIMTALAMAARGKRPVVVFAGDAPIGASWYIQSIDQAPLALSAVPYGQAGENAMRFPHLAHRSAAAHKLHSTPQQDRMNLISGKGKPAAGYRPLAYSPRKLSKQPEPSHLRP